MRAWISTILTLLLSLAFAAPALAAHVPHGKQQPEVRVGIMLFDGVQIIDFSGPYEVFGHAAFGVITVSPDGKPVTTAMGLKVTPDYSFANVPAFDVLLVPGGDVDKAAADPVILEFVRQRSASARQTLSVCTGAHILASAGLLDGLKATTFHQQFDGLATMHPKVTVVRDQRWVDTGKIITSAGLSSGIDAALHLVAKLRGEDAARTAAMHMEYDWQPDDGFVRGRMADRHFPKLKDVEWPKDMAAERLSAFGDERHWRTRHSVQTATSVDELMQRIARSMDSEGWQRQTGGSDYRWQRDLQGQRLEFVITTRPTGANAFELEATLAEREAASPTQ